MSLHWVGISMGIGLGAGLLLTGIVYTLASMRFHDTMQSLTQTLAEAGWTHRRWLGFAQDEMGQAQKEFEFRQREMLKQREAAIKRYQQAHQQKVLEIEAVLHEELTTARTDYAARRQEVETLRDQQLKELDTQHQQEVSHATAERTRGLETLEAELDAYSADRRRRQAASWHQMKTTWEQQLREFQEAVQAADRERLPRSTASGRGRSIPRGRRQKRRPPLSASATTRSTSTTGRKRSRPTCGSPPRRASFRCRRRSGFRRRPRCSSRRGAKARESAVKVMQTAMLRLLTHLPPGKLRFTIIDLIGLGESFGGFMHLADYDELLVTSRIWTEPGTSRPASPT